MLKLVSFTLGFLALLFCYFVYETSYPHDQLMALIIGGFFVTALGVSLFADDRYAPIAQWVIIAAFVVPVAYVLYHWFGPKKL